MKPGLRNILPRTFRPEVYQGRKHPQKYFEGWYNKLVDGPGDQVWAFIAGMSYAAGAHAFIQVIHANTGQTWYIPYSLDDVVLSRKRFDAKLGDSRFSSSGLELDIRDGSFQARGQVRFLDRDPFPGSLISPGIMGWYSFVPGMECYHGVVSMQHRLEGELEIQGSSLSFEGGRGYVEKDWGRSMPSDWIWIQSNHFAGRPGSSFMLSVARIPWMKGHFPGFLSFLRIGDRLHRFATYNGARIADIRVDEQEVLIRIVRKKLILEVRALRKDGGVLKAPRHGEMDRDIQESIVSRVFVQLRDTRGTLLFEEEGLHAGLEIVGDIGKYIR